MAVSKIKGSAQVRTIAIPWTMDGYAVFNTNLYQLINNDLPSGYRCLGIVGYGTGQNQAMVTGCRYFDSAYSLEMRNIASAQRNGTMTIHYLCEPN